MNHLQKFALTAGISGSLIYFLTFKMGTMYPEYAEYTTPIALLIFSVAAMYGTVLLGISSTILPATTGVYLIENNKILEGPEAIIFIVVIILIALFEFTRKVDVDRFVFDATSAVLLFSFGMGYIATRHDSIQDLSWEILLIMALLLKDATVNVIRDSNKKMKESVRELQAEITQRDATITQLEATIAEAEA